MKRRYKIVIIMAFAATALVPAAYAQWETRVSPPNVFGNMTVNAAVFAESGDGLVVQCNNKATLDLAYVFPATPKDLDRLSASGGVPGTLLLKVDSGPVMKLAATVEPWNNKFAGFVASGRNYDIVQAINAIGTARNRINVGVNLMGNQQADDFTVDGSTAAMSSVERNCALDKIKPDSKKKN